MSIRQAQDKQRLIIIDGNAILHRAYHAMPPLTTSKGELVNAVYGFCSMLLKVRDELNPSCFAVTFDLPKPTFRKKLFAGYQAKRPKMVDELSGQIERVKELVRTLGIPIYEKEGYEADDVIGTLAFQAEMANSELRIKKEKETSTPFAIHNSEFEIIVVTGDRDLLQLVDNHTKVYMLIRGLTEATLFDEEKVIEKYGLRPAQIPDYKALIGDQSDNYSGVSGIGPKTAVNLLSQYGTVEKLYKEIEQLKKTRSKIATSALQNEIIKDRLIKGKQDAKLSKQLATIITNVSVKLNLKKCQIGDFSNPEVIKFLEELEFKSLIGRLSKKPEDVISKKTEDEKKDEQMSLLE
ncbi:MAG: 5'-3' exonuclease H3TH domain-containing protein [Candidatus Gottesmanbacteria bacterium]